MTSEEVFCLFITDKELRQYIIDHAKNLSTDSEIQADLVTDAWKMLGKMYPQKTTEYYKRMCYYLMHRQLMMELYKETVEYEAYTETRRTTEKFVKEGANQAQTTKSGGFKAMLNTTCAQGAYPHRLTEREEERRHADRYNIDSIEDTEAEDAKKWRK